MKELLKNNAISPIRSMVLEQGFTLFFNQNETAEEQEVEKKVERNYIQFHFCIKGGATFHFNKGRYDLPLSEEKSLLLYNPQRELPMNITIMPKSWVVSMLVSIKKLHTLFSNDAGYINFLMDENKDKKYYQEGQISPAMAVVLNQMLNFNLNASVEQIYLKAKVHELVALYFNRPDEVDVEHCPFLVDEENVRKIRKAKELVLSNLAEPPGLKQLSEEIGLSLKKLKEGFKEVYGDTVYGFLLDYKMEYARKLLESGSHNVNEVSHLLGYSTSSHFIAAFKKKFGTTPKKYLLGLQNAS